MNRADIIERIKNEFSGDILNFLDKSEHRVFIDINPGALVRFAGFIWGDLGARFNIASGVDGRCTMEILYHFTIEKIKTVFSLRVTLDKKDLSVDSITPVIKGAEWIEREMHELLGINFKNHPNLKPLLLPEDWPDGVHPLRRDYKEWDNNAVRDRGA